MVPVHPIVVHFAVALPVAGLAPERVDLLFKKESLKAAAFWSLIIGLGCLAAAVLTGLLAEEAAEEIAGAESLVETHKILALITLGLFAVRLAYRFFLQKRMAGAILVIYLILGGVALGTLTATGWYGGRLVFEIGAGVQATAAKAPER